MELYWHCIARLAHQFHVLNSLRGLLKRTVGEILKLNITRNSHRVFELHVLRCLNCSAWAKGLHSTDLLQPQERKSLWTERQQPTHPLRLLLHPRKVAVLVIIAHEPTGTLEWRRIWWSDLDYACQQVQIGYSQETIYKVPSWLQVTASLSELQSMITNKATWAER